VITLGALNASEWTGPGGNNTYLFPGPPSILIDAGIGNPAHIDAIASALRGASLDLVLVTHAHWDHASGVPALLARWPDAVVRGGPGTPLRDGEVFEAGDVRLAAVHTPGHAPDHFCFLNATTGELFCGDLARAGGTIVIPASKGGNLRQYLESLERVLALAPAVLHPAHGPTVAEPARVLREYLAHRAQRDIQVRKALAAGRTTPEEIVEWLYPGLSPSLKDAARESVLAHLQFIREGR
jgi:glyoxylase-like metal-dependent hydrolase (beta-lactamase superfamily II)